VNAIGRPAAEVEHRLALGDRSVRDGASVQGVAQQFRVARGSPLAQAAVACQAGRDGRGALANCAGWASLSQSTFGFGGPGG
jgi:hypothetical protein